MAERKNVNNGDWDAKGDLLAGTANDAFDQVAVGANNTILTADSTVATGMKWAAPAAPTGVVLISDFDAKGDLLVGTANDAFDQLAVGANGTVLEAASGETTGAKWDFPPGYELAAVDVTADVVVTATVEASSDTLVSLGAVTYAAVPTVFQLAFSAITISGAMTALIISLFDGATQVNRVFQQNGGLANGVLIPGQVLQIRITPTAASHTYSFRAFRAAGTSATFEAGAIGVAGGFMPIQGRAITA